MGWLARERPELVKRYEDLYARGANASPSYRSAFDQKVRPLLDKHGFGGRSRHRRPAQSRARALRPSPSKPCSSVP